MTATELLTSLDRTISQIRDDHATSLKALEDRLLAAQIELELFKNFHSAACADRDKYYRIATKFVTQFGTVEAIFAEVKTLALAAAELPPVISNSELVATHTPAVFDAADTMASVETSLETLHGVTPNAAS